MFPKQSSSSITKDSNLEESSTNDNTDTIPDEEFSSKKFRNKLISWPNSQNGPNINLHFNKKRFSNQEERNYFYNKIKKKKKTELCKNWELYHDCFFKDECSFAHGIEELRQNLAIPSYKTKECKSFQETKVCPFGARCSYRHIFMYYYFLLILFLNEFSKKPLIKHSYQLLMISKELQRELTKETNKGVDIDIIYRRIISKKKVIQLEYNFYYLDHGLEFFVRSHHQIWKICIFEKK